MKWNKAAFVIALCAPLTWGGAPGQQRASSHEPQLVHDLRVTRKGDKVMLTWRQPRLPADRQSLPGHLVSRVCRSLSSSSSTTANHKTACAHPVGEVDPQKETGAVVSAVGEKPSEITLRFSDTLPEQPEGTDPQFAVYTVEVRDNQGKKAGVSNSVSVPLAPLPQTDELHSQVDVRGVYLIWSNDIESPPPSSLQFDYRVSRSEKGSSRRGVIPYLRGLVHTRDGDRWSAVDTSIEWEKTYLYWVTPLTKVYSRDGQLIGQIEGEDSGPVEVTTHDVFPPDAPERLLVIVGHIPRKKFVDLLWAPNIEKDLAGYNVYRRREGEQMVRINSAPITMFSFQDTNVAAGTKYFYCISAVDLRANESAKSPEIAAVLP